MKYGLILLLIGLSSLSPVAQTMTSGDMAITEEQLRASNKQLNQFIRRFNGEEDEAGNRFYETDKRFRDDNLRKKYFSGLFDQQNASLNQAQMKSFFKDLTDRKNPLFLDFHGDDWFSEVRCQFVYRGKTEDIVLMMVLQQQGQGYEWVIDHVSCSRYDQLFDKDMSSEKPFIHPMSHELDFMTLKKAFDGHNPTAFTMDDFKPDMLTLFLSELMSDQLKFKSVLTVRYHFFQIPGWYFELVNFNRTGNNSGWLISNLVQVDENQKQTLKQYIYGD